MVNPRELGLPHDAWREGQYNLYQTVMAAHRDAKDKNEQRFVFGQLPTGSGKTAVAAALGHDVPVLYIAATLGLLDQAEREYGFIPIKGRQEYECVFDKKVEKWLSIYGEIPTAADCHFPKMSECPKSADCPYLLQKHKALYSSKAACTYKYIALSGLMQNRPGILVLDECHEAIDQMIGLGSFSMDVWKVNQYGLPTLPFNNRYGHGGRGDIMRPHMAKLLNEWFLAACYAISSRYNPETKDGARAYKLRDRMQYFNHLIKESDWFLEAGPGCVVRRRGGQNHFLKGFTIRPLDPSYMAQQVFSKKQTILLMSATIGKTPESLADGLGIENYDFVSENHPVPWYARPVYDLGVPRMTKSNLDKNPNLYETQAKSIAHFIQALPDHWRGIVLTSSNQKVSILRKLLPVYLRGRPIYVPDNKEDTSTRIEGFLADDRPGLVAIDTIQGWGHGLDLRYNIGRFVVIAGVPFENPSDPFVRARRKRSGGDKLYWWTAYNAVFQAAGRVSRGERKESLIQHGAQGPTLPTDFYHEDFYEGWLVNVAAIADGSATSRMAKRHYPDWFETRPFGQRKMV